MPSKSTLAQSAHDLLEMRRRHYAEDFRLLIKDYREEKGTASNYNGRQLLELLQNADDAAGGLAKGGKVLVRLSEEELTVANTGEAFTQDGFESILYSNLSPKYEQQNRIGAKGLGFRAVLGWADRITIHSGGLHVAFSEEYAQRFLADLKGEYAELAAALQKRSPNPKHIATLSCAELLPEAGLPNDLAGYDTVLTMRLRPGVADLVLAQIDSELDAEVLVFLNHLNELRLELPAGTRCLTRTRPSAEHLRVDVTNETSGVRTSKMWRLVQETGRHGEGEKSKNYELRVAWQADLSDRRHQLYSYFRTRENFPFPVLAHGTFELSSERNSLEDDPAGHGHNRFLLERLAVLLGQAALKHGAETPDKVTYQPLRMLNWGKLLDQQLEQRFKFGTRLKEVIAKEALFPTIASTYIVADEAVAYAQDFAAYLDPSDCPELLMFGDTAGPAAVPVRELLQRLDNAQPYTEQHLLDSISKRRRVLPAARYAELLALAVDELSLDEEAEVAKLQLPVLFFGGRGRTDFAADSPVFLPVEGKVRYELPEEAARLQVMSVELANGLRDAFECASFTELGQLLSPLRVQPYSFTAVAEVLIDSYKAEKPEVWHPFLYKLYQQERAATKTKLARLQLPEGLRLYTATGKVAEATTLYFGRTHGNLLGEELFAHNRARLVGSAQRMGLDPKESDVLEYLTWCGVEKYPRLVKREVTDNAYREEILRMLDYKSRPIANDDSRTYEELWARISYTGKCEAYHLEDFEEILRRAPLATVLTWLKHDERLAKRLEPGSREPSDSRLTFWIKHKRNETELSGRYMPSYLRWQCQRLQWLPVEGLTERVAPLRTLHSRKAPNLQPILYAPIIPYNELLTRPYPGLTRPDISRALTLLGVALTVSEVPTTPLYKLLLELPELVPDVQLAGAFYRELVENYEGSPNINSPSYQQFRLKGRVACQRGQEPPAFYPVQEAVYVDNSSYGAAVVACFPVLMASRKRGKDRVLALFGVKPLDNIPLRLEGPEPTMHPVQSAFATDFDDLRGYVLALRRSKNTTDSERLRKLRMHLSQQVEAAFTLPATGVTVPVRLGAYEFVYLPDQNRAYVEVPATIGTLSELKDSDGFCECLAEVLCTALGVVDDKDKYNNLLSRNPTRRRSLLRTWLGAEAEPELSSSQQELNLATESQHTFWNALRAAVKLSPLDDATVARLVTADQWLGQLVSEFGEEYRSAFQTVQQLDFTLPFTPEGLGHVRALLMALNVGLPSFNAELGEAPLDFRPFWLRLFGDMIVARRSQFELALHEKLRTQPLEAQQQFQKYRQLYQAGLSTVDNVLDLDLNALFTAFAGASPFGVKVPIKQDAKQAMMDLEKHALSTDSALRALAKEENVPEQTVRKFLNELSYSSLLYFQDATTLLKRLLQAYPRPTQTNTKTGSSPARAEVTLGDNITFAYDDLKDLAEQLDALPAFTSTISTIRPLKHQSGGKGKRSGAGKGGRHGTTQGSSNDETAFLGEYSAYRTLCSLFGADRVEWCSELAVKAGRGYGGLAGHGYDMRYRDDKDEVRYVEVKASTGEMSVFHLSRNELQVGESSLHRTRYELVLVSFVHDIANLRIERIAQPFNYKRGESFIDNPNFGVEEDSFLIRFKRQERK
jgi:hypothetical protein